MSLIKQPLTEQRLKNVMKSLAVMNVMINVAKMEYMSDMDVNFRNPLINQFAGRILKDIDAILQNLKYNPIAKMIPKDEESIEEYAGELYRVVHYFLRLPLAQVREVMDNLEEIMKGAEV